MKKQEPPQWFYVLVVLVGLADNVAKKELANVAEEELMSFTWNAYTHLAAAEMVVVGRNPRKDFEGWPNGL